MLDKLIDADAAKELVTGFLTPLFEEAAQAASSALGDPLEAMLVQGVGFFRNMMNTVTGAASDFVDQLKQSILDMAGKAWDAVTRPLDILGEEIKKFYDKFLANIVKVSVSMLPTA